MFRHIAENRYTIRKYLRALSVSKNIYPHHTKDLDQAIKFFIILHNMLILEEEFYDQCVMAKKEINRFLHLERSWRVDDILGEYYKLYDRKGTVRKNVETLTQVEEIRYILRDNNNLFKKLKL